MKPRCLLFLSWLASLLLATSISAAMRPNFVVIFADNLGMNDASCYGSEIPTPNIDAIARTGIKFENWYSGSPVCTPSRFSMMTGQYPNRSHDQLLTALMPGTPRDEDRGIRPHETTIAELFHQHGYHTAIIGKWHLGHGDAKFLPTRHGFDSFYGLTGGCIDYFRLRYGELRTWYRDETLVDETGYATDKLADEAVRFLENQKAGQPFYLYLPFNAPHYGKGWDAEKKKYLNILQPHEKYLPAVSHLPAGDRRDYAAMAVALDVAVGRVLDTLNKMKLTENTLVVFVSDNGGMTDYGGSNHPFRGQIATPYEGGIRVPCVMRWPGKIPPGRSSRQPASTLDLFPTLCHFAGLKTTGLKLDGMDLSGVLLSGKEFPRDLFWRLGPYDGDAFIRGPWKYVRYKKDGEMLFHLPSDPGEKWNLAKEKPGVLAELKAAHEAITATLPKK